MITKLMAALLLTTTLVTSSAEPPQSPTSQTADRRMDWWREARFGLFIHWGLYAVPAGEWNGNTNYGEWIMHSAHIPVEQYEQFTKQFNPVRFNADEWVRIAKNAGMKYIVITSKHHDGFCLFDSALTDYDVMSTPFKRDIMKELADACGREGLKICWYHSIMDWHHADYLPRRPWEKRSAEGADFDRYVKHLHGQVRELLTKYGPIGVMWFDGEWEDTWHHEQGLALYKLCRSIQPDIIVNNRVDKGRNGSMEGMTVGTGFAGDFGTPEQQIPPTGLPGRDWETCMTMNHHWGYNKRDNHWKSSRDLIRKLCDIASKGGNFLLNVGPKADGTIPQPCIDRLAALGRWMRVNGQAIYGTKASPFRSLPWGRCTQRSMKDRSTRLYLHVFDWPQDGKLRVPGLLNQPLGALLLTKDGDKKLDVTRKDDALVISVPARAPDANCSVVALDIVAQPNVNEPPNIVADTDIFVDSLTVHITCPRKDSDIRYTTDGSTPSAHSPRVRGPISVRQTTTIKARRFIDGKPVSELAEASYQKVAPRPASNAQGLVRGVCYSYFEGNWSKLPDFDKLEPVNKGTMNGFAFDPRNRSEHFAFRYSGYLTVPTRGVFTFYTASDDGSRLYIGDTLVVDNDGLHNINETSGSIALSAGLHPITVTYFERTGGDHLEVFYQGPGIEKQAIPLDALTCAPRQD